MKLKFVFVLLTIVLVIAGCATKVEKHSSKVEKHSSKEEGDKITEEVNLAMRRSVENENCIISYVHAHQRKVFEECEKSGRGVGIGGGCYHIVGYSITVDVLNDALIQCNLKEPDRK